MGKEKRKNTVLQARVLPFIALWGASYAVAWLTEISLIPLINPYRYLPASSIEMFIIGFLTLLPALIQAQLVKRMLGQSMRRWMLYSLLGALISVGAVARLVSMSLGGNAIALMMLLMIPPALLQMIWLYKRVKSAWLWIAASSIGSLLFGLSIRDSYSSTPMLILAALLYGVIQGAVMITLLTQPKENEKAKVDFATDEDEQRAQRLQENEAAVMASISDAQGSQQGSAWKL